MVHTFGELNDGDVVKVALDGLYRVSHEDHGTGYSWVKLESVEGHDDWTFEDEEGTGWEITKVAKEV